MGRTALDSFSSALFFPLIMSVTLLILFMEKKILIYFLSQGASLEAPAPRGIPVGFAVPYYNFILVPPLVGHPWLLQHRGFEKASMRWILGSPLFSSGFYP